MQWSRSWGCRVTLAGTIVLLCALLAGGCRGDGPADAPAAIAPPDLEGAPAAPAPVAPVREAPVAQLPRWPGDCDPAFAAATQQVLDSVRLVYRVDRRQWRPPEGMAFYIGNDEWVTTAWGDFSSPITLYQHDPTTWDWRPDVGSRRDATLIGRDADTGLALLQADGRGVPAVHLASAPPRVGERLRRVDFRYGLDDKPREHVWWPPRCAAAAEEPTARGGVPPGPGFSEEEPVEGRFISLQVLEGTVLERLTVDGRHYLHHDMWLRTRTRDYYNVHEPTGAPLFTADGAVVGVDGRGIWRADPAGRDRADVFAYDIAEPTLPAVVARIRANAGQPGDAGGTRQILEAFCPKAWWDAARETWRLNQHPATCRAHAQAGITAAEAQSGWSFWFSGPGRRDRTLYRLTDHAGQDTHPRMIDRYSVAEDPQRHLLRLPPGLYGMEVVTGFAADEPIWSNRVTFRLLPAAGDVGDDSAGGPQPAPPAPPPDTSSQAWRAAADRAAAATFLIWTINPSDRAWYQPTPFMAVHLGNDEWITVGSAAPRSLLAIASRHVATTREYTDGPLLREATVIGVDEATGLALLRAAGADVPALALAADPPGLCVPLLLAGYWEYGLRNVDGVKPSRAPQWTTDCEPAVFPEAYWPATDDDVREEITPAAIRVEDVDLIPGPPETALAGVFRHQGLPYLLLHPPDPPPPPYDVRVQGGPVIDVTGQVVGLHAQVQRPSAIKLEEWYPDEWDVKRTHEVLLDDGQQWALATAAIQEALARIRAAAALDN